MDTALLDELDVITDATEDNPNRSCEDVQHAAPEPGDDDEEEDPVVE